MATTKGMNFVNARAFCEQLHGADAWERVLARLAPSDAEVLRSVVGIGWYELALYARMIRAIDLGLGQGDLALLPALGRFEAEQDMKLIYRVFFRLANPAYAIEKMMDYWRRFHDTGVWHVTRQSPKSVSGTLEDWGVVDEALCLELTGYLPRVIELVGGRNAVMAHPRCRGRGHVSCVYELTWD